MRGASEVIAPTSPDTHANGHKRGNPIPTHDAGSLEVVGSLMPEVELAKVRRGVKCWPSPGRAAEQSPKLRQA